MRVNVYAEEMTDRIEIIAKEIDGHKFTGLRFYLELPATDPDGTQHQGPFMHRPGDDDSAAVTFWGKRDLREVLRKALFLLNLHYGPDEIGSNADRWRPVAMLVLAEIGRVLAEGDTSDVSIAHAGEILMHALAAAEVRGKQMASLER